MTESLKAHGLRSKLEFVRARSSLHLDEPTHRYIAPDGTEAFTSVTGVINGGKSLEGIAHVEAAATAGTRIHAAISQCFDRLADYVYLRTRPDYIPTEEGETELAATVDQYGWHPCEAMKTIYRLFPNEKELDWFDTSNWIYPSDIAYGGDGSDRSMDHRIARNMVITLLVELDARLKETNLTFTSEKTIGLEYLYTYFNEANDVELTIPILIGGSCDLIIDSECSRTVCDFKTTAKDVTTVNPKHVMQIAAYAKAITELDCDNSRTSKGMVAYSEGTHHVIAGEVLDDAYIQFELELQKMLDLRYLPDAIKVFSLPESEGAAIAQEYNLLKEQISRLETKLEVLKDDLKDLLENTESHEIHIDSTLKFSKIIINTSKIDRAYVMEHAPAAITPAVTVSYRFAARKGSNSKSNGGVV